MALTKHIVGADGVGQDLPMSPEEEAATLAEWQANASAPAPEPVPSVEDRLAALEEKASRSAKVEAALVQKGTITAAEVDTAKLEEMADVKGG